MSLWLTRTIGSRSCRVLTFFHSRVVGSVRHQSRAPKNHADIGSLRSDVYAVFWGP